MDHWVIWVNKCDLATPVVAMLLCTPWASYLRTVDGKILSAGMEPFEWCSYRYALSEAGDKVCAARELFVSKLFTNEFQAGITVP